MRGVGAGIDGRYFLVLYKFLMSFIRSQSHDVDRDEVHETCGDCVHLCLCCRGAFN